MTPTKTAEAATEAEGTARRNLSRRAGRLDAEAAGAYVGDLFAEHGTMVLGLCRLLLRDPVEADDAAQQVFLSAHQAVLRGSHPRDAAPWLGAIARNECRARIRARMREPLELPELASDLPDPLAAAIRAADLQAIWLALGTLPRRQRRALVLRELGGLSYHELGRSLGVSHAAVESLLFRARQQVRSLVAGVNVALAPAAVRDQLVQLVPRFDAGSASLVARVATVPIALKLAGAAAVGVGVVTTGAGGFHSRAAAPAPAPAPAPAHRRAVAARPSPRAVHLLARTRVPVVHVQVFHARRRHQAGRQVDRGRTEPAEHAEQPAPATEIAEPTEGRGPQVAAEPAQVEQSHEGSGDGGHTATAEDHPQADSSGDGGSGGGGGGSGNSGPG